MNSTLNLLTRRLIAFTVIVLLSFVVTVGIALVTIDRYRIGGAPYDRIIDTKDLLADILPPPLYLVESQQLVLDIARRIDDPQVKASTERLGQLQKEYTDREEFWKERGLSANLNKVLLENANAIAVRYFQAINDEFLPALAAKDQARLDKVISEQLELLYDQDKAMVDQAVQAANLAADKIRDESIVAAGWMRWTVIGCGVAALLLIGLLSWRMIVRIALPLRLFLERLTDNLRTMEPAVVQVRSTSNGLSDGSSRTAASLEETVASLENLAALTRRNAEHARQADTQAQAANQSAMTGETEARNATAEVVTRLRALRESLSEIDQATKQTSKVVETIDEIAFQTNLLALNAAVEAARAGDAGAGFAVVADEVRNLAQRSAEEVKSSNALMERSRQSAERVVQTANDLEAHLRKVLETDLTAAFGRVVEGTSKVTALMSDVSQATTEQAQGVDQIRAAMTEIDQVTQANAASAEETAAVSNDLAASADALRAAVDDLLSVGQPQHGERPAAAAPAKTANPVRKTQPLPAPAKRTTTSLSAPPRAPTAGASSPGAAAAEQAIPLDGAAHEGDFSKF